MSYFSKTVIQNIVDIFSEADQDGRSSLFEHEVYQILTYIGLPVPKFMYIEDPSQVDQQLLLGLGPYIMVKIVSPQIVHKQVVGGVKKVKNEDPLFIQYILNKMREEVLSHFSKENIPKISGFLLAEFIPHTQALGYEQLIGIKDDAAFGPVLTLSKGGDDAEFFAQYFDPANLFLPPLNEVQALTMVHTLNIEHKFEKIEHPEYARFIAKSVSQLSYLAYDFSWMADEQPEYRLKTLDINPFVITEDDRLVAIDGFAEFIPNKQVKPELPEVRLENLNGFFRPQGVAVIGVSADLKKHSLGREIAKVLHELKRQDLYFINIKGGSIQFGDRIYPFYRSMDDLPAPVDLLVYAAPSQATISFFQTLSPPYPKAVILISGLPTGFNYADFASQLSTVVPEGVRVIGPNCMGVFWAPDVESKGINTLFVEEKRLDIQYSNSSNTVLLTQSGAFSVTEIDRLQNNRLFKAIVSFGNKYDVNSTDLTAYFAALANIDLIALYVEGFEPGEGRKLFELSREISKPIIIYKAGRTEAGARAAASHTASISGSYDVFKAACQQSGMILATNIEDHYDYVKVFSLLARKIPVGNRVAGVVNAGFESTVGADELKNLKQAHLSDTTVAKLHQINKHGLVDVSTPFLDITPMADDRMYADFVETIIEDPNVDCIFVAIVPHSATLKTTPDTCQQPDSLANLLVQLNRRYQKPIVISVNAGRYYQDFVAIMERNGLPVYTDIRAAIKSLDTFVTYHLNK